MAASGRLDSAKAPQKDLITTEGLRPALRNAQQCVKSQKPQKDLITTEGLRHDFAFPIAIWTGDTPKRPDHHGGIETFHLWLQDRPTHIPQKDLITTEGLRRENSASVLPEPSCFPQKDLITTEGLRHRHQEVRD